MMRAHDIVVFSTPVAKFFLDWRANFLPKAAIRYGLASELKADIEQGASFDIALLTEAVIDDLIELGILAAASRIPVFRSGVGLAVRRATRLPPVSSAEELKLVLLQAESVGIRAGGAGGAISKQLFERMGIAETMAAKTVTVPSGTLAEAIVSGAAENWDPRRFVPDYMQDFIQALADQARKYSPDRKYRSTPPVLSRRNDSPR